MHIIRYSICFFMCLNFGFVSADTYKVYEFPEKPDRLLILCSWDFFGAPQKTWPYEERPRHMGWDDFGPDVVDLEKFRQNSSFFHEEKKWTDIMSDNIKQDFNDLLKKSFFEGEQKFYGNLWVYFPCDFPDNNIKSLLNRISVFNTTQLGGALVVILPEVGFYSIHNIVENLEMALDVDQVYSIEFLKPTSPRWVEDKFLDLSQVINCYRDRIDYIPELEVEGFRGLVDGYVNVFVKRKMTGNGIFAVLDVNTSRQRSNMWCIYRDLVKANQCLNSIPDEPMFLESRCQVEQLFTSLYHQLELLGDQSLVSYQAGE